ncbi:chemotaxis signal transduction protein [Beggiatoa alba B18LD]|uniref:Chemotaxis signal transduction protein n=1 Tax=Beggiatoa alba B18LD TaxID=395493 RepID=I3CJK0_9GAMM|nr:chemotaxis protein CheW [Beggiatoa alba]EIJ43793.1 chemotaxis signal transduction protein [Beggiatoa alba B18LD]
MADTPAKTSRAWLLDFGRGLQAAVGLHEMSQVVLTPTVFEVPYTPHYCSEILSWQDQLLPVVDVPSLLEGQKVFRSQQDVIGIAVYQKSLVNIGYAGVHLANLPTSLFVSDDQACALPPQLQYWQPLAIACFNLDNTVVPIIDLARLFSPTIRQSTFPKIPSHATA